MKKEVSNLFKYDPGKSLQEMADDAMLRSGAINKVKVIPMHIKSLIESNEYDYSSERFNCLKRRVEDYISAHPDSTLKEVTEALSLQSTKKVKRRGQANVFENVTIPWVELVEYLHNTPYKKPIPKSRRFEDILTEDLPGSGLKKDVSSALTEILNLYLPDKKSFDCDLTFGKGDFYSGSLAMPAHRFDVHPVSSDVKELKYATELPSSTFSSVIVDLPGAINPKSQKEKKKGSEKEENTSLDNYYFFKSEDELKEAYEDMIMMSSRLLMDDGILVFHTWDAVHREKHQDFDDKLWSTEFAIDLAYQHDMQLIDQIIVVNPGQRRHASSASFIMAGNQFNVFLVFKKNKS